MNTLAITCSARNIPICEYWRNRNNKYDHLIVKHYPLSEALNLARNFFLKHSEYTHLLIWAEDVIANTEHAKLLEEDYETYKYKVISGYSTISFTDEHINITQKDLSKEYIYTREQYNLFRMSQVIYQTIEYPIIKVFFQGHSLSLIERSVVEKIPFRHYKIVNDMGVMQDLQFAIDLHKNNIPQYVDLRVYVPHLGDTTRLLNLNPKERKIIFKTKDGKIEKIEENELR